MKIKQILKGVTLVEMLLVMVIISWFVYLGVIYMQNKMLVMRINKTGIQMQQILTAGLAYYTANNSTWPTSIACLQGTQDVGCTPTTNPPCCSNTTPYLPPNANITSPFNASYVINSIAGVNSQNFVFEVSVTLPPTLANAHILAEMVAGRLALATVSGTTVTTYTNIPGEAINKAPAAHFAGTYYNGGCIPVPVCPFKMKPEVFVMVQSVTGLTSTSGTAYSLTSYGAFAVGSNPLDNNPPACPVGEPGTPGYGSATIGSPSANGEGRQSCTNPSLTFGTVANQYWRACVYMTTSQGGDVAVMNPGLNWGNQVQLVAFTRCAMPKEAIGSGSGFYTN